MRILSGFQAVPISLGVPQKTMGWAPAPPAWGRAGPARVQQVIPGGQGMVVGAWLGPGAPVTVGPGL